MASFRDVLNYYQKYHKLALWTIGLTCLLEASDLVLPYIMGQILNVLSNQSLDPFTQTIVAQIANVTTFSQGKFFELGVLIGFICLFTVIKAPLQAWVSAWYHWGITLKARRDQLQTILGKILTLPLSFYDEHNPGRIANRIARGVENHMWSYPEIAGQVIPKVFRVFVIIIILLLLKWWISLVVGFSFIFILLFSWFYIRKLISQEELLDKYMENTQSRNSEIITNIKTVKAFATEAAEFKRQKRRIEREFKYVNYRIHFGYVRLLVWQRTLIQLSLFCVIVLTLIPTVQGQLSLGYFVTIFTLTSIAYAELDPLTDMAEILSRRYTSIIRLHEFTELPSGQDAASLTMKSQANNPYQFTGKIDFKNVSFGYDENRLVLKEINLLIEPCQTVALVGHSGSGKSTLVKLLFRYFQPNQGHIFIDGKDLQDLDITDYRHRLAMVHQEVDIFNGTVLDNLTYGNPTVSFSDVLAAAKIAKVDDFIHELSHGYYTIVGERGVRLSGGQRQRLGIARALIVNPDILVFDEATSSLDYESERAIQLAMKSILGTRTTLIIAHRLSTVREADKIVVLDQGRIVEIGSHQELLNHQGIYHRLHSLQETGELLA
ncbi:MAG: ABC transporter ATP-binding protein [Microcystaceae cyanobacterium]